MHFHPGPLLSKVPHDGAFKGTIRDLWRKSNAGHADGVISDKIVEVAFAFINEPIGEKVVLQKDDIAVTSFECETGVVVFLSGGEKMGEFLNEGVLDGNGVIRCLGNNARALDGGIGMNSFFPSESNWGEVVG